MSDITYHQPIDSIQTCCKRAGLVWEDTGKNRTDYYGARCMDMYQHLFFYKMENKDTLVPVYYKKDSQFGGWVAKQRAK